MLSGNRTSGGTLSAPAGCSPRDRGRLRAVGGGLRIDVVVVFFYSFHSCWADHAKWEIEPVGERQVHPLGVVPQTTVECLIRQ